jgi:redox-sensitive bicupin YhaK (pirin superfamily)
VINEDRIDPGTGFGEHSHRDMEIISYVLSGELAHKDSMGNVKAIPPGDIQRMSAGTGVTHSEFNYAKDQTTHFLQIWIQPKFTGIQPGYDQKTIPAAEKNGKLRLLASPDGTDNSITINADAKLYAGTFDGDQEATLAINANRKAYVHLIKGTIAVNGLPLSGGDAVMIAVESTIHLSHAEQAEVLVFDLV